MKLFITSIITLLAVIVLGATMRGVSYAYDAFYDACSKLTESQMAESEACQPKAGDNPIYGTDGIFLKVTNLITIIAGVISVIIIIIAGMQFVFSNGDPQKAASARNAIIYTVVGIIIVLVARSIIALVISYM